MQQKYRTTTYALSYWYAQHARRTFMLTLTIFLVSFAAYMFFVVSSLSSGVAYQQVNREIKNTESSIAQLEADRIARMKSVDLSFARDRGFVEVSPTRYIARNDKAERFSLRTVR